MIMPTHIQSGRFGKWEANSLIQHSTLAINLLLNQLDLIPETKIALGYVAVDKSINPLKYE